MNGCRCSMLICCRLSDTHRGSWSDEIVDVSQLDSWSFSPLWVKRSSEAYFSIPPSLQSFRVLEPTPRPFDVSVMPSLPNMLLATLSSSKPSRVLYLVSLFDLIAYRHSSRSYSYKQSGEPFYNCLSMLPLHGKDGQVKFFIGGQVDIR